MTDMSEEKGTAALREMLFENCMKPMDDYWSRLNAPQADNIKDSAIQKIDQCLLEWKNHAISVDTSAT